MVLTTKNTKLLELANACENDISHIVVDCVFRVHKTLGPGLLESTYEACLVHELKKRNIKFGTQKTLPVLYDDIRIDAGYRVDILIEDQLIVELKSVEKIIPLYQAQLMTYLKLSKIKTGLLINFNSKLIKDGIRRISV